MTKEKRRVSENQDENRYGHDDEDVVSIFFITCSQNHKKSSALHINGKHDFHNFIRLAAFGRSCCFKWARNKSPSAAGSLNDASCQ